MNTVRVRGLAIGEGRPKICVPAAGRTREEIGLRLQELKQAGAELAEWRADWYEHSLEEEELQEMLGYLREELGELPLLVTFRTKAEGGEREISTEQYGKFLKAVIRSGKADLVDAELFRGEELLGEIVEEAHKKGVYVVASSHDFEKTPAREEMVRRLCSMQECGADLLKLAVMPGTPEDVLRLLEATWEMRKAARQPLITMAMGKMGAVSRISGELFGSALTFGTAGVASAPGQIPVAELKAALRFLEQS